MKKTIKITISEDGEVSMEVQNAVGEECLGFSKDFEDALGTTAQRNLKDSFYSQKNENDLLSEVDISHE